MEEQTAREGAREEATDARTGEGKWWSWGGKLIDTKRTKQAAARKETEMMDGRWGGEKERDTAKEGDYWGRDGKDIGAEKEAEQKADKREKESEKDLRAWPEFQILEPEGGKREAAKYIHCRQVRAFNILVT